MSFIKKLFKLDNNKINTPFEDISFIYDTLIFDDIIFGMKMYHRIYNKNSQEEDIITDFKYLCIEKYDSMNFYRAVRTINSMYGEIVRKYRKNKDEETLKQIGIAIVERLDIELNK